MFTDLHFEQWKFSVRVNSEKNSCKSQQQTANYNREEITFLAGSFLFHDPKSATTTMEAKRPCCGGNFLFEIRNQQIDALAMSPLQKSTWQRSHTVALCVHGSLAKDFLLRFSANISMRWPFLTVRLLHFEIRNHQIDALAMSQLPKCTWKRSYTVALCVHGFPAKDF